MRNYEGLWRTSACGEAKSIAWVLIHVILAYDRQREDYHGRHFVIGEVEKYPHYLALASGGYSEEFFARWLRETTAVTGG